MAEPFGFAEPDAGVRFQADALLWARTNPSGSSPIIGGPDSFSFGALPDTNYVGGYRLGAAWLIDPNYEFEGVWTWFTDWNSTAGGVLPHAIAFNGGVNSPLVDPTLNANFISTGTFFRPLFDAAMDPLTNPTLPNFAFMNPGSTYSLYSTSTLYDVQANFKTRAGACRRFSFGVGYRNIHFNESTSAIVSGTFGTNDIPGGGNQFNILQHDALVSHGLEHISGAADGFTNTTPGPPTSLSLFFNGATTNVMNGGQLTMDGPLMQRGIFTLESLVRAGIFFNHITGSVQELYAGGGVDDSVYGRQFTDERDVVSFAGNFGLNAVFQLGEHVRYRAGYEIMVLTNTALGPDQQAGISTNGVGISSYTVQGGSTVVFHGFRTGLEFIW